MFRRLADPLPLSEASLLVFRPAMNAPVLNVGYLPVGPARGAVVAFAEEYGGIGIALGLRAVESGQLAVLRNPESIDFEVPLAEALEPLIAWAERMGFLFDEDVLETDGGARGRARAMELWAQLMGGIESLIPPREPARPADQAEADVASGPLSPSLAMEEMQYPEMMLDDVAPFTLEDADSATDQTETLEPDVSVRPVAVLPAAAPVSAPPVASAPAAPAPSESRAATPSTGPVRTAALPAEPHDEILEDGLDDLLDDSLDPLDPAGERDALLSEPDFDEGDVDGQSKDSILGEADLTQPTAPIPGRRVDTTPRPEVGGANRVVATPARPVLPVPESEPARNRSAVSAARFVALPPSPRPIVERPPVADPPPAIEPSPVAVAVEPPVPAPVLPRTVLSKFRQTEGMVASPATARPRSSEVGADRSAELARIPIVRVKRERDATKRVPLLARLLSSF